MEIIDVLKILISACLVSFVLGIMVSKKRSPKNPVGVFQKSISLAAAGVLIPKYLVPAHIIQLQTALVSIVVTSVVAMFFLGWSYTGFKKQKQMEKSKI